MKKTLIIVLGGILLITTAIFIGKMLLSPQKTLLTNSCTQITARVTMTMRDEKFIPENMTIKRCTEVTFTNSGEKAHWPASDIHPTHGIYPEFDPLNGIAPGKSWAFVFDKVGTWRYHDHLFPLIHGMITVESL